MKTFLVSILCFLSALGVSGQTDNNCYLYFEEFRDNSPSLKLEFQLNERTEGDIFMMGGISNHRLKKVKPSSETDRLTKEVWGVKVDGHVYINSYPYSRIVGFNRIIETGHYSYFIGEPARREEEQRALGIIGPSESQLQVCCNTGYVILPNGKVRHLNPKYLLQLFGDNEQLRSEAEAASLAMENVDLMFDLLSRYNAWKQKH